MRTKSLVKVTLAFWIIVSAGSLDAQERGSPVSRMPTAASRPPNAYVQPFGVPLAPPVYFVNFLLLYWSNPEIAANMPELPTVDLKGECLVAREKLLSKVGLYIDSLDVDHDVDSRTEQVKVKYDRQLSELKTQNL